MQCPKCGSEKCSAVAETKGFVAGKGCLGVLIFGPLGFLCGLCGMGKTKKVFFVCGDCKNKFNG